MISQHERHRRWATAELERSLQTLAGPAEVQFQLYPKGVCYACELAGDFQNFWSAFNGNNEEHVTKEQRSTLTRLQEHLAELADGPDYQCWNEESIRTGSAWERARELAKQSLGCFDWEVKAPPMR